MRITFLGTGTSQGVPVIGCTCEVCRSFDFRDKRLRVSVLVETGNKNIVIDTGPDFRQQMLRARVQQLDAVLFTHQHKDHTAGLDDIRPFNFLQQKDMPVYARAEVLEQIKKEYSYIFDKNSYPGVPRVSLLPIVNEPFVAVGIPVLPIEVLHHRLPVFGFRIGDFAYITDANHIPPAEIEKIAGVKVLVLNALQKTPHISHFTLEEALAVVKEVKPAVAYFTHMSHTLGLHSRIENELPQNVHLAYDGLQVELE